MKSDAQLEADVAAELRWEAGDRASAIELSVRHGMVALSGVVSTPAERRATAEAAQRVFGVRTIRNRMIVRSVEDGAAEHAR